MPTQNHRSFQGTGESFGSPNGANTVELWGEEYDTLQDGTSLRSVMLSRTGDCNLAIDAADSEKEVEQLAAYDTLPCPPPDFGKTTQ